MARLKLKFNSDTREWSTFDPFTTEEVTLNTRPPWKHGYCKDCGREMCPAIDRRKDYCIKCDKE